MQVAATLPFLPRAEFSTAQAPLASSFTDALNALGPFGPTPHFAVAVSGGADSLALTFLADRYARSLGGRITALTVDHRLRPESTGETATVAALLQRHHIAHHILTPDHTGGSRNLQEAARGWRYTALTDWCRAHEVLHCLIAHHAGDQRETVALHTARGDTADGSSGMAAVRNDRGIRLLRPLLAMEKSELENWLQQQAIGWVDDPSNRNPRFARVALRQQLAAHPAQQPVLDAQHEQGAIERTQRDDALAAAALQCVTLHAAGFADLDLSRWCELPPALATQLLADLLVTVSGATTRPRAGDTQRLATAFRTSFTRRTLHGCEISPQGSMLRIAREFARAAPPLVLSGTGSVLWDNRFQLHYALPDGVHYTLSALGTERHGRRPAGVPRATPMLTHLDEWRWLPHITPTPATFPGDARITIGFAPAKPLAAAPFWWLNT